MTLTVSNGTLTLNGTGGLSFSAGDGAEDTTMTFTGTIADINAALDGMIFVPTADYLGAASLAITTDDQGYTGTDGPQSDTDNIDISVEMLPVNGYQPLPDDPATIICASGDVPPFLHQPTLKACLESPHPSGGAGSLSLVS